MVGARPVDRLGVEHEVVEVVELAVVVERLGAGPRPLDDLDVLAGARVPLVLGERVALAALLVVVAAGDEVHRQPAAGELVQRRERLRRVRRVRDVGPVREQQLDRVRPCAATWAASPAGSGPDGAVGEQDAGPAVVLVGADDALQVVGVERRRWCGSCVSEASLVAAMPRNSTGMGVLLRSWWGVRRAEGRAGRRQTRRHAGAGGAGPAVRRQCPRRRASSSKERRVSAGSWVAVVTSSSSAPVTRAERVEPLDDGGRVADDPGVDPVGRERALGVGRGRSTASAAAATGRRSRRARRGGWTAPSRRTGRRARVRVRGSRATSTSAETTTYGSASTPGRNAAR